MAHSANRTIDHDEIRRWVEQRGGKPAHVKRTTDGGDPGVLRIDFPGFSGEGTLEELAWDEWLDWFDRNELAFLYQDEPKSRFNKLVRRNAQDESEQASHAHAGGAGKAARGSERETRSGDRSSGKEAESRTQDKRSSGGGAQAGEEQRGAAGRSRRFSQKTERVTINDASEEELDALWGVGPQNARRIIEYRRRHGQIRGVDDLIAIDGIDRAFAQSIAQQVDFG